MSGRPGIKHLFHLKLGGGTHHRIAIAMSAIVAAQKGYRVEDQSFYKGLPTEPDLVISKQERMIDGAHRKNVTLRYRLEVVESHDPIPDGRDPSYDDVLKIDIGDLTLDEIYHRVEKAIP